MKLKTALFAVVLLVVGVVGGSPYYAAHQIHQALKADDALALARHVDFPRVRDGFKTQLSDALGQHLPEAVKNNPLAVLGAAVANAAADQALNVLVTPDGVMALLNGRMPVALPGVGGSSRDSPNATPAGQPNANSDANDRHKAKLRAKYLSWDSFEVRVPAGERTVPVLLTREGMLTWRVTRVGLPELP